MLVDKDFGTPCRPVPALSPSPLPTTSRVQHLHLTEAYHNAAFSPHLQQYQVMFLGQQIMRIAAPSHSCNLFSLPNPSTDLSRLRRSDNRLLATDSLRHQYRDTLPRLPRSKPLSYVFPYRQLATPNSLQGEIFTNKDDSATERATRFQRDDH
jgi:hypothetical protein